MLCSPAGTARPRLRASACAPERSMCAAVCPFQICSTFSAYDAGGPKSCEPFRAEQGYNMILHCLLCHSVLQLAVDDRPRGSTLLVSTIRIAQIRCWVLRVAGLHSSCRRGKSYLETRVGQTAVLHILDATLKRLSAVICIPRDNECVKKILKEDERLVVKQTLTH